MTEARTWHTGRPIPPNGRGTSIGTNRPPCRNDARHTAAFHAMTGKGMTDRPVTVSGRLGWSRNGSAENMIADRVNFRTHGALSGRWINRVPADTGQATADDARALFDDVERFGSVYAVFSYATPIAWITPLGAYVPNTRYVSDAYRADGEQKTSVTTAKHLGIVRLAVSVYRGTVPRPDVWEAR